VIAVTIQDKRIKYTVSQTTMRLLQKSIKGFVLCGFSARLAHEPGLPDNGNLVTTNLTGIDTNST